MAEKILRLPTIKVRTGLSRSSIYQKIASGVFPKPISHLVPALWDGLADQRLMVDQWQSRWKPFDRINSIRSRHRGNPIKDGRA